MNPEIRPRMSFQEMIQDCLEANAKDVPGRQLTRACEIDCEEALKHITQKRVTIGMGS